MIVTDIDLVRKIMSLPSEQREELLMLLGDNEKPAPSTRPDEVRWRLGTDALRRRGERGD